jgi:hypothetical protein
MMPSNLLSDEDSKKMAKWLPGKNNRFNHKFYEKSRNAGLSGFCFLRY